MTCTGLEEGAAQTDSDVLWIIQDFSVFIVIIFFLFMPHDKIRHIQVLCTLQLDFLFLFFMILSRTVIALRLSHKVASYIMIYLE